MRHRLLSPFVAAGVVLAPLAADAALSEDDFYVRSAQDLVELCSSPESDPLNDAADHFCHGFLSGAWQYHQALANGPDGRRLVCPPDPPPTRNEVVRGFVAWSSEHAEYLGDSAVDTLFRYLVEIAPCPEGGAQ